MTIAEHLQQQLRTCNRIKWGGVLLMVLVAIGHSFTHATGAAPYAWTGVALLPWLVVFIAFSKRVKCPRCQKPLFNELAVNAPVGLAALRVAKQEWAGQPLPLAACPQCGCSFSEPYFGG